MVDGKRRSGVVSPPDGGWGWVIVGCCFMVTVCTRAVTRCISIFFVEFQAHFGGDYAATAWIHSLVDCTTMLFAPVGSLVGNRWSCRVAVMLGGLLSSCGLLLSSFTTSLESLYLTMGVLTGLGFALCYTPAIAMVGCYFHRRRALFHRRRALAYGIAMSGSGIGTFVLAPAVQLLIELYSWRGALLILSAFVANMCVCGALLRPIRLRECEEEAEGEEAESVGEEKLGHITSLDAELAAKPPKESDARIESAMPLPLMQGNPAPEPQRRRRFSSCFLSIKEYRFLLLPDFLGLAVSFLFLASGCSLPFVYLVPYALSAGVRHHNAAFLMSILGVLDIVGNITFGWLTDRRCLKPYRLASYVLAVAMEGLCCLFTPLLRSFSLLVPFAVLYGYFDGAYVALIPVVTSDVVGAPYLSSALGVVYFLHAIPYLISPPIGGWLVDVTGSYTATFFLSGVSLLSSAVVLSAIAGIRRCRRQVLAPPPVKC
ncbi:LOW QUALITY PROTEIN: monocarboxylate transporter 12-B-like [Anoplopoma fimbria]|uniref:LOW QUALITY PROTEIN: monocarboxylate transporter 12-B-like n=1 Tax=Anoplopoma fimbria TaxID=229290 RepID=UPI0023EAFCEA|nr:LOW QUALITY PROTEIN: monocarboxylate transporter 12-B-like [Anoplopoma fimbria]